tara:strand:- start:1842 stop:2513 length:672 start_codon:yes stop_codon:yes gene_type:complete
MTTEYFIDAEKISFKSEKYIPNVFPNTWFINPPIDAEHKHWKLLAYLQRIDENISKGYLFQEFYTLNMRYKDLDSFITTFEIVNKDTASEKLFNYIYELPDAGIEMKEVNTIVGNSIKLLKKKYLELTMAISFLKDHIVIENKQIVDGRKNLNIYIEMCSCNIIEHYTMSKKGIVDYKGAFNLDTPLVDICLDENFIDVKTDVALSANGVILPHLLKFSLSRI